MSAALHSPSLAAELRELQARLDRLERTPLRGARDEPMPMVQYPWWPNNSTFNRVCEFSYGNLNNPVIRAEFRYTLGGSGTIEFRLRDLDSGVTTAVYSAGIGGNHSLRMDWLHPFGDGFSRATTGQRKVEVQARIASGTPSLSGVWPGTTYGTTTAIATGATASGYWQWDAF